ncbi:hypothetical protein D081_1581 [Anaerovibrio sp. JC8]|uniref:hypothetical protein n=1 Tax=Anaerovibrio sp. JC8 TaxID=1240085 RepID=UPI000A0C3815|nr:hypothetical protein [Anaerovibrio sp. JC8]ORU00002.1 hypothetical protein D081_1581 [Anaerovibrio sp. JC8]
MKKIITCMSVLAVMLFSCSAFASEAPQDKIGTAAAGAVITEESVDASRVGAVVDNEPMTEEAINHGTVNEKPDLDASKNGSAVTQRPIHQEPAIQAPTDEGPMKDEPVLKAPQSERPIQAPAGNAPVDETAEPTIK